MNAPDLNPEFRANLPRTGHNLGHDLSLTCTTGHLNPVFHTIVNPGETIKLGFDFNVRTMPLEAAAFGDFECHTEYFFVPLQMLFQPSDTVIYGITDQFSSMFPGAIPDFFPVCDMQVCIGNLNSDHANAAMVYPGTTFPVESVGQSAIRLLDLLGFNPIGVAVSDSAGMYWYNPSVFPYQILAYNCIYQYYYRIDSRESFNNDFNVDAYYNSSSFVLANEMFLMKYRPLGNDYFTDLKVSPIVDVLNLASKTDLQVARNWLTRSTVGSMNVLKSGTIGGPSSNIADSPEFASFDPSSRVQTQFGFSAFSSGTNFNGADLTTSNIRAMFASEKLWSITGRAKKNYDDQTLAHFGFKVPHDVKHQISCFGHDTSYIHVGEVISTANTTLSPLGEIAGKGYGSQQVSEHSFTAPCHGVIMVIFSIVAKHNYEAGVLKCNSVATRSDLYQPEYDHIGMQPLFGYETQYFAAPDTKVGNIIGWQYRYEQWKRRYNRVTGAFKNFSGSLKGWIPTFMPYNGSPQYMMDAGKDQNLPNTDSYTEFINLPTDVNQLFLAQYPSVWSTAYEDPSGWAGIYDNDPFVVNSHINATLVSTMSDYSLPRLDG